MKPTDIRVRDVSYDYEDYRYRSPIKFGGVALDRVTILNARVEVETRSGQVASGFGPKPRMPLYHLVGALDPLTDADVTVRLDDGLPNTLGEWIKADGLTHLKVKLNGDNLEWDVERVIAVNWVAEDVQRHRGVTRWW